MKRTLLIATLVLAGCDDGSEAQLVADDAGLATADAPPGPDADPHAPDAAAGPDALAESYCDGTWTVRVATADIGNCPLGPGALFELPVRVAGASITAAGFAVTQTALSPGPGRCSWRGWFKGPTYTFEVYAGDSGTGEIIGNAWVHGANCMQRANLDGVHAP